MTGNGLTNLDYDNLPKLMELISAIYDSNNSLKKAKYFPVNLKMVAERKSVDRMYARVVYKTGDQSEVHHPPIEKQNALPHMRFDDQNILESQANIVYFGNYN